MSVAGRPKLPKKLEDTIRKILYRNGCANVSAYHDVFYEVPSEEDFRYIAKTMQGWQVLLPALGIFLQTGKDINTSFTSPEQRRIEVLMEFHSTHGVDATYNKLILAFFKEQKMDLVSKVVEKAAARLNRACAHQAGREDSTVETVDSGALATQEKTARRTPINSGVKAHERTSKMTPIKKKSLTVHNILEVLNTGEFPAANCEELGLALDIKKYVLHNILSNRRGQVTLQLADIFEHWLNNDLEASWDKVADALEKCGYKKLAYIISGKMKEPSMQARDEDLTTVPRYIEEHMEGNSETSVLERRTIRKRIGVNLETQNTETATVRKGKQNLVDEMEAENEREEGGQKEIQRSGDQGGNQRWWIVILFGIIIFFLFLVVLALRSA